MRFEASGHGTMLQKYVQDNVLLESLLPFARYFLPTK
jgi:hypothetical protein